MVKRNSYTFVYNCRNFNMETIRNNPFIIKRISMNYKELKEKIKQILEMEYFGDITQEQAVEAILKEVIPMVEKKTLKWVLYEIKINEDSSSPKSDVIKQIKRKLNHLKESE